MQEESTTEDADETGADSATDEEKRKDEQASEAEGSEDSEGSGGDDSEGSGDDSEASSDDDSEMTDIEEQKEDARKEVEALEGDPPQDLSDWPTGKAQYETFGGAEHSSSYDEAATSELGPSDVRHREDGSVEVHGEKVDNPEDYKSDPIPGGPTDPNTPTGAGEPDLSEEGSSGDGDGEGGSDDSDSSKEATEASAEDDSGGGESGDEGKQEQQS